jgi:hypothetical protein
LTATNLRKLLLIKVYGMVAVLFHQTTAKVPFAWEQILRWNIVPQRKSLREGESIMGSEKQGGQQGGQQKPGQQNQTPGRQGGQQGGGGQQGR